MIERDRTVKTCVSTGEMVRLHPMPYYSPFQRRHCASLKTLYNSFSFLIKYIANALSYRSEPNNIDELDGIDNIRNGLLLHRPF